MPPLDITFDPQAEVNGYTRTPATPVRVYASSVHGGVTVYMPRVNAGLRLTQEQVISLRDALTEHLEAGA